MRERTLFVLEQALGKARWTLPDDFDTFEHFQRCLRKLDHTSSPGLPYCYEYPTIGQWLGFDGVSYNPERVKRLWEDVQLCFKGEWMTILRAFVKKEPHKISKKNSKRWRLILASPLCVQMMWHMLFSMQNDVMVDNAFSLPTQFGMSTLHGQWKLYLEQWKRCGYKYGLDKTAWDWHMPFWMFEWILQLRFRLGNGRRMNEWMTYARRAYADMYNNPLIMLSNGKLYRQLFPGVQKSGVVNTISDNSMAQLILHVCVCIAKGWRIFPLPKAVGDDTLQTEESTSDLQIYRRFGALVKSATEGLEFVGHFFRDSGPEPVYVLKHFKQLLGQPRENWPAFFDSMNLLYTHSPLRSVWRNLAYDLRIPIRSEYYYRYLYDYPN